MLTITEIPFVKQLLYMANYAWRAIMTGLCCISFLSGGLVLSFIFFPIISLLSKTQDLKQRRAQFLISVIFDLFIRTGQFLRLIHLESRGFDTLENMSGAIIIANHPTLIDYVIIISKLRYCNNVVKGAIFKNFFFKRVVSTAGYIPSTGSIETLDKMRDSLEKNENILIFPEGTRTVPNQPITLQRGAAHASLHLNAPIQLIHISTSEEYLSKSRPWYKLPKHKVIFKINVGERINPSDFATKDMLRSVAARTLTRYIAKKLEAGAS